MAPVHLHRSCASARVCIVASLLRVIKARHMRLSPEPMSVHAALVSPHPDQPAAEQGGSGNSTRPTPWQSDATRRRAVAVQCY